MIIRGLAVLSVLRLVHFKRDVEVEVVGGAPGDVGARGAVVAGNADHHA